MYVNITTIELEHVYETCRLEGINFRVFTVDWSVEYDMKFCYWCYKSGIRITHMQYVYTMHVSCIV